MGELVEGHVAQGELAGGRDHHAVQALLDQGAERAYDELAAEHQVERLGLGAARLVAEVDAAHLALASGLPPVGRRDLLGEAPADLHEGDCDVPVGVARQLFEASCFIS